MEFTINWMMVTLSVLITVAVYSFLYRENMAFRLAEHVIIGSFTGHALVMAIKNINESAVARVSVGEIGYFIPIILGVLFFTRYIREYDWLQRYPLAVVIGISSAVAARSFIEGWIWKSLQVTISTPLNNLDHILILLAMLIAMSYFTFTIKHTGVVGSITRIGKIVILLVFGLTIPFDLISRLGSITSRLEWMIQAAPYVTAGATLLVLLWIVYDIATKGVTEELRT